MRWKQGRTHVVIGEEIIKCFLEILCIFLLLLQRAALFSHQALLLLLVNGQRWSTCSPDYHFHSQYNFPGVHQARFRRIGFGTVRRRVTRGCKWRRPNDAWLLEGGGWCDVCIQIHFWTSKKLREIFIYLYHSTNYTSKTIFFLFFCKKKSPKKILIQRTLDS